MPLCSSFSTVVFGLCPVLPFSVNSGVPPSVSSSGLSCLPTLLPTSAPSLLARVPCVVYCKTLPCCWQNRTCRFYHRFLRVIAEALTAYRTAHTIGVTFSSSYSFLRFSANHPPPPLRHLRPCLSLQ